MALTVSGINMSGYGTIAIRMNVTIIPNICEGMARIGHKTITQGQLRAFVHIASLKGLD